MCEFVFFGNNIFFIGKKDLFVFLNERNNEVFVCCTIQLDCSSVKGIFLIEKIWCSSVLSFFG